MYPTTPAQDKAIAEREAKGFKFSHWLCDRSTDKFGFYVMFKKVKHVRETVHIDSEVNPN